MAALAQVVAKLLGKGQAQQQLVKERAPPLLSRRISGDGGEAMPEWKLNCLCADSTLPPTVRGHMTLGGCF